MDHPVWQNKNKGVTARFQHQGEDGARADPGGLRVRDHSRDARLQREREGVARVPRAPTLFVVRRRRRRFLFFV